MKKPKRTKKKVKPRNVEDDKVLKVQVESLFPDYMRPYNKVPWCNW